MASIAHPAFSSLGTRNSPCLCAPLLLARKSRASSHLPRTGRNFTFARPSHPKPLPSWIRLGFSSRTERGFLPFIARNGGGEAPETAPVDEADEARGKSTMPERFRHLAKEVPDRPVRWPWFVALIFPVFAWRAVLWELTNWKKTISAVMLFFSYLGKLVLALVFHFVGDLVTETIRCIEFCLYSAKYVYANIVTFAPVPELTRIILFSTAVLSLAEATVPDSVNNQTHLLTLAGCIGFGAVEGFIPELLFWLLLAGLFCYSRFINKKDYVSALLPSAAVLAAIGEPWVRGLVISLYLALAIFQHSKTSVQLGRSKVPATGRRLPVPLLLAALSIGVHLAAKWVRHRHLTWMIA